MTTRPLRISAQVCPGAVRRATGTTACPTLLGPRGEESDCPSNCPSWPAERRKPARRAGLGGTATGIRRLTSAPPKSA